MQYDEKLSSGVVVVTGATGGLGQELVRAFVQRNVKVAALARDAQSLEKMAKEFGGNGSFLPFKVDLENLASIKTVFKDIGSKAGPITVLMNNAAVYPKRDFLDETPQSFARTININLCASQACSVFALHNMVQSGYGKIVNVTSFADLHPTHLSSAYSVSKGAQKILTRAILADIGDRFPDIILNDWVPGALNTKMGLADGIDPKISAEWGVKLALWHDRELSGKTFERNNEVVPPKSKKQKIQDFILGKRKSALHL